MIPETVPDQPVVPALSQASDLAARITGALQARISGKPEAIHATVLTLLAGGHLLIDDVPGVGKTTLATTLARSLATEARRVQFTSDMLPTDVTGVAVYDQERQDFRFHPGPVFTHILVGDEINRATPKTQSALLEAMAERSVTVDGHTRALPDPFFVVATQNPQDMEGTFPLPEAQRDRFMTRISLGYPDLGAEIAMLATHQGLNSAHPVRPVAQVDDVRRAQHAVSQVALVPPVARYLVTLVSATREHPAIQLGGSPRASLHLAQMARARAAVQGRDFVSPDDIAALAGIVLSHRLVPHGRFATASDAVRTSIAVVAEIVARTPAP